MIETNNDNRPYETKMHHATLTLSIYTVDGKPYVSDGIFSNFFRWREAPEGFFIEGNPYKCVFDHAHTDILRDVHIVVNGAWWTIKEFTDDNGKTWEGLGHQYDDHLQAARARIAKPTREQLIAQLEDLTDDLEPIVIERVPFDDGTGRVLVMNEPLVIEVSVNDDYSLGASHQTIFSWNVYGKNRDRLIENICAGIRKTWIACGIFLDRKKPNLNIHAAMRVESPAAPEALEALEGNADE